MFQSSMNLSLAAALLLGGTAPLFAQTVPPATPEQVNALIDVLKSDAAQKEKADACRQLAIVGTKEAVPALAALLADEKLSHMARYGLEPIPDPSVDAALRAALETLKGRQLAGVIGSIGVRRDAQAVAPLVRFLKDADPDVAKTAAKALGKIATPEAAAALKENLAVESASLRAAVANGCLGCAESLLAQGKRAEAAAIYDSVAKAELPKHFRIAAAQGAILARQPASGK